MAEDDEIARLRQMESGAQESMGWDVAGQVEVSQNSSELVKEEPSDDHVLRASHSAPLDTRQFSLDAQQSAIPPKVASSFTSSANSTPNSVKRPRIIGGFMVDSDSEDEQESKPTVATLHPPPAHSASKSPMHLSATPDQLDGSNDLRQGATDSAPSASNTLRQSPTVVRRGSTDAQQATQPKARLPHDKIGILEDRIAEDPRGDIEAWMELIYEHESRNKLDEARAIYERFFTVFPTAVSGALKHTKQLLILTGRCLGPIRRA